MGFIQEFKTFAMRGNVMDMAVGIIIGAAFGKIVSSFVGDIMMPPLGLATGGIDFSEQKLILRHAVPPAEGVAAVPEVSVNYGMFLNATINFIIVAFAVFLLVKGMNRLKRKEQVAPPAPQAPTKEQVLLTEIRDALRNQR
jgi:large conductance mechanosensitive channel